MMSKDAIIHEKIKENVGAKVKTDSTEKAEGPQR